MNISKNVETQAVGMRLICPKQLLKSLYVYCPKITLAQVIHQINNAGYFSVGINSTPDMSHVDKLPVIVRYVLDGKPMERFLTFIDIHSHISANLAATLLRIFLENNIGFSKCRGQRYGNASNMSGHFKGMPAKIKEVCP